jgi:hypothetical protein
MAICIFTNANLFHDCRHDFINPYGISLYNRKDLHCHQRVVIEFKFTYAVRDQLAANLYHEQKSNLQK